MQAVWAVHRAVSGLSKGEVSVSSKVVGLGVVVSYVVLYIKQYNIVGVFKVARKVLSSQRTTLPSIFLLILHSQATYFPAHVQC